MANEEHLAILRQGVEVWNKWRLEHPLVQPDLSGATLIKAHLSDADLSDVDLSGADLSDADLSDVELSGANLSNTDLTDANLSVAHLREALLSRANLYGAKLNGADLSGADLRGADLKEANVSVVNLRDVHLGSTIFANNDLSTVKGLDIVTHHGPSTIGTDTLILSQGKIPESFLRGCGVPDSFIEYLPALIGAIEPIQFYSCFIAVLIYICRRVVAVGRTAAALEFNWAIRGQAGVQAALER